MRRYIVRFLETLFLAYGVCWAVFEPIALFAPETVGGLRKYSMLVLVFLGLGAALVSRPKKSFKRTVKGRDIAISIVVGDAFDIEGDVIIPTNNRFDMVMGGRVKNAKTLQGTLLRDIYRGREEHLRADVDAAISSTLEEDGIYPIGTVATIQNTAKTFHLVATTGVNNAGAADTAGYPLDVVLGNMWARLSESVSKGTLIVPLIATGQAKSPVQRGEVVMDIIRSFIAASTDRVFCDDLIIVIFPSDVTKGKVDMDNAVDFLDYSCRYASHTAAVSQVVSGTGLG